MKFAKQLKELRIKKGLSQEELAEAVDVTKSSISKWENGTNTPDLTTTIKLANFST